MKLQRVGPDYRLRQDEALAQRVKELDYLETVDKNTVFEKKILLPEFQKAKHLIPRAKANGITIFTTTQISVDQKIKRAKQDITCLKAKIAKRNIY